jgi:cell division transport system ATP-binding protein
VIEFIDVSKTYPNGTQALRHIDLKIEKGEFVYIVGASGAGKSTFLKLLTCEEKVNSGEIIINDHKVSELKKKEIPYLRRTMGLVFQDFRLIDKMTVYDNVAFAMRIVGASQKEVNRRVPYILNLMGLRHKANNFPTELSGGEQQRVGLARALVNNPAMIIADEPTGNIDPAMSFEMLGLLSEINRRGTTVVMVTHEHVLVRQFPHRVVEINQGRIVADSQNYHPTPEHSNSEVVY